MQIVFRGVKYTFFGGLPQVKVAFQGLNITLLGSPQPADMKNPAERVLGLGNTAGVRVKAQYCHLEVNQVLALEYLHVVLS